MTTKPDSLGLLLMNTAAQQLGRLGAGKKKTLTREALKQRRKAARISARKRKGRKTGPRKKTSIQANLERLPAEIKPPDEIAGTAVRRIETLEDLAKPMPAASETLTQEPCQPPENGENKEKDISCNESVSDIDSFNERKHLLA